MNLSNYRNAAMQAQQIADGVCPDHMIALYLGWCDRCEARWSVRLPRAFEVVVFTEPVPRDEAATG